MPRPVLVALERADFDWLLEKLSDVCQRYQPDITERRRMYSYYVNESKYETIHTANLRYELAHTLNIRV